MAHNRRWAIEISAFVAIILFLTLSGCSGGGGGGDSEDEVADETAGTPQVVTTEFAVLGFNDLGMHCVDLDYSVFVTLPPFNVVHAQVVQRGSPPRIVDNSQTTVTYQARADGGGSINTTSQNSEGIFKTNFWDINPRTGNTYAFDVFAVDPPADEGLAFAQRMPGFAAAYSVNDAQLFNRFDAEKQWFSAIGVPILPVDDAGALKAYPLMSVQASDRETGDSLAALDVVLPVASEADCQNCHSLGEVGTERDGVEFVFPDDDNDPNSVLQAAKVNILRLHDSLHDTNLDGSRPVLCAGCHYSVALDLSGAGPDAEQQTHDTMSRVMHNHHGKLVDPATGQLLFPDDGTPEETCYQCHPGKVTQCLRGAMGGAGIVCQDCHGGMLAVGGEYVLLEGGSIDGTNDRNPRRPWIDEPRCQSCHTGDAIDHLGDTIRLEIAYDPNDPSASPILATNKRFAENEDTLYRDSLGHGGVACEGCHGSTHAIWPNANLSANDNRAAEQLQGHAGTVIECGACHTSLPLTMEGPHGMHNVADRGWNEDHEDFYEQDPRSCQTCHGINLEGTVLSRTAVDRVLLRDDDGQTITLPKDTQVSCSVCHERPD